MASERLTQIVRLDGFSAAAFGPLALSVWERRPTAAEAATATALLANMARTRSDILVMAVIGPGCPTPDGPVRDMLAAELQRIGKQIRATANVVEGQGFSVAALRGVLTGMNLVLRPNYQTKVFSSVREAADFLAVESERELSTTDIATAVRELRLRT